MSDKGDDDSGAAQGGAAREVRTAWAVGKPGRHDFAAVVTELNASKLVGEGSVFERGAHVPVTHMGYFKAPTDAFLTELRSKDRRSAKEWEYVNAAGVWTELGLMSLEVARTTDGSKEEMGRQLKLAEMSMKAALEVLSMRAQYFRDITEQGVEIARQMAFLVEQGHDAVFSESYRSARDALTSKMEVEAAKQLAKARLEKARGAGVSAKGSGSALAEHEE